MSNQVETRAFQAEVKQLLQIVVHSLYSNREIFLRELISNSADAIDKLRFAAISQPEQFQQKTDPLIQIEVNKSEGIIRIKDNGIGLSQEDAVSHLGTIAKSGTREFLASLSGDQQKDARLIGQFGVGFYSAFMVADAVTVISRRADLPVSQGVRWHSDGLGDFTVTAYEKSEIGTEIILKMKEDAKDFLEYWRLRQLIQTYSDHISVPIQLQKLNEKEESEGEWETINRATALWAESKSQITDQAYQEFYKHISHDFNDALAWTHNRVETGQMDYIALLYIPEQAPFDLWKRDEQHGLKLFVQRVFILDKVQQFLPSYLRFVRGIVDTNALPLNISREMVQDHPVMQKIRSALVRHILDLLEKLKSDQPEKYLIFWKTFGAILKEGIVEDFANRDRISKLILTTSTHSKSESDLFSLSDYVSRMKADQNKLYYLVCENFQTGLHSPHLEMFKKQDVEVLLLTDRVDDWVVNHMGEFEKKSMQSVTQGDFSKDEFLKNTLKEEEENQAAQKEEISGLPEKLQEILKDQVQSVRVTARLTESPACLVRDENSMSPQMLKLLQASGQAVPASKPILEINPEHPIVKALKNKWQSGQEAQLQDWSHLLFEQAALVEGTELPDRVGFVKRMNQMWVNLSN